MIQGKAKLIVDSVYFGCCAYRTSLLATVIGRTARAIHFLCDIANKTLAALYLYSMIN